MLIFLDYFLLLFHLALTAFNALGWAFERTRKAHLILILLTLASWTVLSPYYGWGYCPFTDWHWQVKRALGESPLPGSFIKYCIDGVTGWDSDPTVVTYATAAVGVLAFLMSIVTNVYSWRKHRVALSTESV
ncbi:DUF2784 domain-containing protein [Bremerella sp. T1]|uniref:DUF2784 domain-containing protein n=1 Tax=Bremerella sp. TYQ1 TaxID=3119568 RepID=UPI001CC96B31|nr:DUF2784 domain-containing protein [Bremerella volcania]UBM37746.1 DUF2784 domain-containing protein [Bremerella volcania]